MMNNGSGNHLSKEPSLYLQQHAHQAIDWYPWCEAALNKARQENKPIFLSIGYSACHWCHVMCHEAFDDKQVAALLNERFVNIKVDREERPDLDKIYQHAHQLLNGRPGGWPLNAVLTPDDQLPFFAATYIAREARNGLPGFADLMQRLAQYFNANEADVRKQNSGLQEALKAGPSRSGQTGYSLNVQPLQSVNQRLADSFDVDYGGFGKAPKFPQPGVVERLLRHWQHAEQQGMPDKKAGLIAKFTLEKMARGGIYDQLGGGFFRYAVDQEWMVPHFEKMLYDNAQLISLYAQAWAATKVPLFKQITEQTISWAQREIQAPEGGFYASLDADSEAGEGIYYTWTPEQVRAVLNDQEYTVVAACYGLDRSANFGQMWHLHGFKPVNNDDQALLVSARKKLLNERQKRRAPQRDEKILTAWNALMLKGLATAGRYLQRDDYVQAAEQLLDFIQANLWRDNRLFAVYQNGQARIDAYLDDYAYLLEGVLELLQCRWRDGDLQFALQLADILMSRFQDPRKQGGFYFTTDDHESLIQRPKPIFDQAMPSGNASAAYGLLRIGYLVNSIQYMVAAERALKNAWPSIERNPVSCCALLAALEEYYFPTEMVVIRGSAEAIEPWRQVSSGKYAPRRLTLAIPSDVQALPEFLAQRKALDNVVAYLCTGGKCSIPLTHLEDLH